MNKVYLGDGAYATFDDYGVEVSAEREEGVHRIYFEPDTLQSLVREWFTRQPKLRAYLLDVMPEETTP